MKNTFREFPSPGRRIVRLATRVTCAEGRSIDAPEQSSFVNVVAVPEPRIEVCCLMQGLLRLCCPTEAASPCRPKCQFTQPPLALISHKNPCMYVLHFHKNFMYSQISGGTPDLHKDYEEFKLGVPLFSGIKVVMTTGGGSNSKDIQGADVAA